MVGMPVMTPRPDTPMGGTGKPLFAILGWLAVMACAAVGANAEDLWYVLSIDGTPTGWMHDTETRDGEHLDSRTETHISVRRGGVEITVQLAESFRETVDGIPIMSRSVQRFGHGEVELIMRFAGKDVTVEHRQGAHVRRQTVRIDENWMPPAAARRHVARALANGVSRITYTTIQATLGPKAIETVHDVTGTDTVEVFGKVMPCTTWSTTSPGLPGVITHEFVDDRGRVLKSALPIAGKSMTLLRADEAAAKAQIRAPELMESSLIDAGTLIPCTDRLARATYRVRFNTDADQSLPVETAVQRVTWENERTARVEVDLSAHRGGLAERPTDDCLLPSAMIDGGAPSVRALLTETLQHAAPTVSGVAARAEHLRQVVGRHMVQKDLAVGFATASEAATSRQGDCTEHAVLLAALLRAAGIPSRTVTGLVYADRFLGQPHVFVYHMWTQAWIEESDGRGSWHDLDATRSMPYDASHIALGTSTLSDQNFYNDLIAMAPFIGTLKIDVLATHHNAP